MNEYFAKVNSVANCSIVLYDTAQPDSQHIASGVRVHVWNVF